MTFTEAAAQVLRLVGKPLHYKEITDVAIEKNLLSHVGKSPEVTMGARLAALVKKGDKDNPLVRVKPGVFALREWDKGTIDKGLADRTPALDRIAAQPAAAEPEPAAADGAAERVSDPEAAAEPSDPRASYPEIEEEARPPDQEELARAEIRAGAGELFAAEEDDDEPIFGADDDEEDEERLLDRGPAGARRRRRRRRGRGTETRGDDLPSYTVSDAPADLSELQLDLERTTADKALAERSQERLDEQRGEGQERPQRAQRPERAERERPERAERERPERAERERPERAERERPERERERGDRERPERGDRERPERGDRERPERGDRERDRAAAPLDELAGRDLADVIAHILGGFDRSRGPVNLQTVADAAQRRGRLGADLQAGQGVISAAVRADNLRRGAQGQRPRFRVQGTRVGLTEWLLDAELTRLEREIATLADRYRESVRKSLVRKLQELPHRAGGELIVLLLERLGMTELTPVRRTGAHGAELHLAGKLLGPAGESRVAIVVRRDGREIGRERVTELRGALHHYGPAHAGWLITTGQVLSGAREEASAPGAAPISLLDGATVARLCEEHGIGVLQTRITLPLPDLELFESLRQG